MKPNTLPSVTPAAPRRNDAAADAEFDAMLRGSIARMDRTPGLPSNFAARMAARAAEMAAARAEERSRREKLLSWCIPVAIAVAAIAAVAVTLPSLPAMLWGSLISDTPEAVSGSALSFWCMMGVAFALLFGADSLIRRHIAARSSRK